VKEYVLLAQHVDDENPEELKRQTLLEPVSWYYVNHFPEYKYRRFFIASVPSETVQAKQKGDLKRKRRSVESVSEAIVGADANHFDFKAGTDDCSKATHKYDKCNGALQAGQYYKFSIAAYYKDDDEKIIQAPVHQAATKPKRTKLVAADAPVGYFSEEASGAIYWIIAVVVLGIMFFIAILVLVVLLCFKRRWNRPENTLNATITPITPSNFTVEAIDGKDPMLLHEKHVTEYSVPQTFYQEVKVPEQQEEPLATDDINLETSVVTGTVDMTQTHSMVILDESDGVTTGVTTGVSTTELVTVVEKEYETISQDVEFGEDVNQWEPMDIQLRIDPTGEQNPKVIKKDVVTPAEPVTSETPPPGTRLTRTTTTKYDENGKPIEQSTSTRTEKISQ
jgi:hypothetical protein